MTRLRARDVALAAALAVAVGAGAYVALRGLDRPAAAATGSSLARMAPARPADAAAGLQSGPLRLPASPRVVPTVLAIPAIGVRSPLERLALDARGVLQPPVDVGRAGWYAGGPVPGDMGPAVIAGHLDSVDGPAVFADLTRLRPGDLVLVGASDGSTVRFRVHAVERFAKDRFPTRAVYGPTPLPTLRLVTCGGTYDHARHRYRDDVVVFAEEVSS